MSKDKDIFIFLINIYRGSQYQNIVNIIFNQNNGYIMWDDRENSIFS